MSLGGGDSNASCWVGDLVSIWLVPSFYYLSVFTLNDFFCFIYYDLFS